MKLPLYQVDAFTERAFRGNPAAVVLLERWLPDATLAAIAAENNLAETAFVIPGEGPMPLRWFTPTVEVDLCGHATLASAHVLFRHRFSSLKRIEFETKSGTLTVVRDGELLSMDFPSRPGKRAAQTDQAGTALGRTPGETLLARDLIAMFDSQADIEALHPDMARVAAIDAFAVAATAPGGDCDYVFRFFAPRQGIPEDPATGSVHCTLAPYWAARLGKTRLTARQLSPRGGEFVCTLAGNRVLIAGRTAEFLRGEITIPD